MSVSKIEIDWTLQQLEALGYIKTSRQEGDRFDLTDKGRDKGVEILGSLPICDRILAILTANEIAEGWRAKD